MRHLSFILMAFFAVSEALAQAPVRTTLTSGTGRGDIESPDMICDGRLSTKWCIDEPGQMPYSITLDAGEQVPASEYLFATGDDTHDYPDRNPVSWRVSGSNDRQTWTTLDEQRYNRRLGDENEQEYRFRMAATGSYRYYRFEFLRMAGGTRLQLSEVRLFR